MSSNKNKTAKDLSVQTAREDKIEFTDTIPLPQIKRSGKYFENFCKTFKFHRATCLVKNVSLFITAENEELLTNARIIIEREIKRFIESRKPLIKMLPHKKISPTIKSRGKHGQLIPQSIIRTARLRNDQHSKHVNQIFRQKRRHWNNIKMIWKQWYINRWKFNAKFKAISQYFGQLSRQRHCTVSLYRQEKRSPIEYHKEKVLGRKRDGLKAKHPLREKRKNKPRKTLKNDLNTNRNNNTSTYKPIANEHKRTTSPISKLKFITADSAQTMISQSKKKTKFCSTVISGDLLKEPFAFSLLRCVNEISVGRKKCVIRYYNQQMFIYTASTGTNRPPKRNLIGTFSTLNGDQMESNWLTEYTRSSPIKQPSPITQQNINSSRKKKPKTARKASHKISAVHIPTDDRISKCVRVKSKK